MSYTERAEDIKFIIDSYFNYQYSVPPPVFLGTEISAQLPQTDQYFNWKPLASFRSRHSNNSTFSLSSLRVIPFYRSSIPTLHPSLLIRMLRRYARRPPVKYLKLRSCPAKRSRNAGQKLCRIENSQRINFGART